MPKVRQNCCSTFSMILQDKPQEVPAKPIEIPKVKPEIKPNKPVPGPTIEPEHPPTVVPEEHPKEDNPKPPEVEPIPQEVPKKLVA